MGSATRSPHIMSRKESYATWLSYSRRGKAALRVRVVRRLVRPRHGGEGAPGAVAAATPATAAWRSDACHDSPAANSHGTRRARNRRPAGLTGPVTGRHR